MLFQALGQFPNCHEQILLVRPNDLRTELELSKFLTSSIKAFKKVAIEEITATVTPNK